MNDPLKSFFEQERKRAFEPPGPEFVLQVMARARQVRRPEPGIWDGVFSFARPVAAAALLLLISILALHSYWPMIPEIAAVDAYLDTESQPGEQWLYDGDELPAGPDLFEQVLLAEER